MKRGRGQTRCSQTSLYEADAHLQRSRTVRRVRAKQARESRVRRHRRTCMWLLCRTQGRLLYVQVRLLCSDGQHVMGLVAFLFYFGLLQRSTCFQDIFYEQIENWGDTLKVFSLWGEIKEHVVKSRVQISSVNLKKLKNKLQLKLMWEQHVQWLTVSKSFS